MWAPTSGREPGHWLPFATRLPCGPGMFPLLPGPWFSSLYNGLVWRPSLKVFFNLMVLLLLNWRNSVFPTAWPSLQERFGVLCEHGGDICVRRTCWKAAELGTNGEPHSAWGSSAGSPQTLSGTQRPTACTLLSHHSPSPYPLCPVGPWLCLTVCHSCQSRAGALLDGYALELQAC